MDDDALLGTLFAGRFNIKSLLGTGGMGSVYLAHHEVLRRHFALKVIRTELLSDTQIAMRFRVEARAASLIDHPNIIRITDSGQAEDGRFYLVMEYVEGDTLRDVLKRDGCFPVPRALDVLDQIVDALAAAHASDVLHRDLKSVNIVLTTSPRGAPDHVKILDFGLAKLLDPLSTNVTVHGEMLGTPEYMSPERCMDAPADHRSDLYSLGIIGFELLTGSVPFHDTVVATLSAHLSQPPPVPSEAAGRDDIPADLDAIILCCLAKKPEDRFQSARELQQAIRALRGGLALAPRMTGIKERAWKEQLLDTRPPDAFVVEEPEDRTVPEQRGHDTDITRRPASHEHPPAVSRNLQALEELAYALRDRRLGTPEMTIQLALLLEARDRQLLARSVLQMLQHQLEELQMTARIRESRLNQLLNQLTHEISAVGDSKPALIRSLEARGQAVTRRMTEINEEVRGQEVEIRSRAEQTEQAMAQLLAIVRKHADNLRELIRQVLPQVGHTNDLELRQLTQNAGL